MSQGRHRKAASSDVGTSQHPVVYFTPEPRTAHLRCRDSRGEWTKDNIFLNGAGSLSGVQSCQITWGDLQLYAEIRGNSQFEVPSPQIIIPPQFTVVSDSEWETLKQITETKGVDQLIAVTAHKMETSVDELVKLHQSELTHTDNTTWTTPLLLAMSCLLVAMLLYYCVHAHLTALTTCCLHKESQDVRVPCTHNRSPQETIPSPVSTTSDALPVKVMQHTPFNTSDTLKKIGDKTHHWCCVKSRVI